MDEKSLAILVFFFTGDDLNINFESRFYVAFEEDSSVCSQRASDSDLSRSDRFSFLIVAGFGGDGSLYCLAQLAYAEPSSPCSASKGIPDWRGRLPSVLVYQTRRTLEFPGGKSAGEQAERLALRSDPASSPLEFRDTKLRQSIVYRFCYYSHRVSPLCTSCLNDSLEGYGVDGMLH